VEITEVRIKLTERSADRLQAFCSITFDNSFVVRDLKIIDGAQGPFVAMPSRKLSSHCPQCQAKNHLKAVYCSQCGKRIEGNNSHSGKPKLYADIAHPINAKCREMIQHRVLEEFQAELELAAQPGYQSNYEDFETYKELREDLAEESGPTRQTGNRTDSGTSGNKKPSSVSSSEDGFGAGIF